MAVECAPWEMVLLSGSFLAGGGRPPGKCLSFKESIDHEWTGLIPGAVEKRPE